MAALDGGNWAALIVTNILNGTVAANGSMVNQGSVVRMDIGVSLKTMPGIESTTMVGSGSPSAPTQPSW